MSSSLSSHDISPPARTHGRRRRRFLRTKVVATAATLAAVVFASACGPSDTEVDLSKTLPTDIPAGTTLVVADQQNLVQNLLAAGGNGEHLPLQGRIRQLHRRTRGAGGLPRRHRRRRTGR